MNIAIHSNTNVFTHSTLWVDEWIQACQVMGIHYELVDLFDNEVRQWMTEFDAVLWHHTNYSWQEMQFARSILNSIAEAGVATFPDTHTSWHFDDKVAQMFLLEAIGSPHPSSRVFATEADSIDWFTTEASYPVVAKLKAGSGASNVKMLDNEKEALAYARRMFNQGYHPAPSLPFKALSNLRSSASLTTAWARLKRAPEFLRTRQGGRQFPRERGYVYIQEFVPNDGFDLKVVVVGDKLTCFGRRVRTKDFRASGGGSIIHDRNLITDDIIESAFRTADALGLQCVGFDYVIDTRTNRGLIIEMSYAFNHHIAIDAGGYWTRDGHWHGQPLNVPAEIIQRLADERFQIPATRI